MINEQTQAILPIPPPMPMKVETTKKKDNGLDDFLEEPEKEFDTTLKKLTQQEVSLELIPLFWSYLYLKPQLQDGPQCGLVALSIASTVSKKPTSLESLYEAAVAKGYTKQGEMFSASWLANIAEETLQCRARLLENFSSHLQCILSALSQGTLLLIPYDADFNHSPCCKMGHKAHWAVASGFIICSTNRSSFIKNTLSPNDVEYTICECSNKNSQIQESLYVSNFIDEQLVERNFYSYGNDASNIGLYFDQKSVALVHQDRAEKHDDKATIYLACRQGKSKHLAFWSFDELALSNGNLVEISPTKNKNDFVLPEGGMQEGLKNKAILLYF